MNADYQKALKFVLAREGGYVNNPKDSGGATNKGITQATYNSWLTAHRMPLEDVKNISDKNVSDIYFRNYYVASTADKIKDFRLKLLVFDTAVNMGVSTAKLFLKQSNGDYNKYINLRVARYYAIVAKYPKNKIFLQGWLNRIKALKEYK